jgi:hypothetical protein
MISFGVLKGAETVSFDGTVAGDTMKGTYTSGQSCENDTGTWEAQRTKT